MNPIWREMKKCNPSKEQTLPQKSIVVNIKKKWSMMNPIWREMKKRNPSKEQTNQLVHWWLLVHSSQKMPE
jgi:hypothetical protein